MGTFLYELTYLLRIRNYFSKKSNKYNCKDLKKIEKVERNRPTLVLFEKIGGTINLCTKKQLHKLTINDL